MKRVCIICDTPYQLFNALNININLLKDEDITIDLYVEPQFPNANEILERINQENIFSKIKLYKCNSIMNFSSSMKSYFIKIASILSPKYSIKKCLGKQEKQETKYDEIYCSVLSYFALSLYRTNNNSNLILFEDGTGSYNGNIMTKAYGNIKLYKFLGVNIESIKPIALFVYNKRFCRSTITDNVCELPGIKEWSDKYLKLLYRVFDYGIGETHISRKITYLTTPLNQYNESQIHTINMIEDKLGDYSDNCIIRFHPRDHRTINNGALIDDSNSLWELKCAELITNDNVLIGLYSTAQFTPKIIYDKEPYLIFLYKMVYSETKLFDDNIIELIRNYRDKSRIYIPTSIAELEQILEQIL